MLIQTFIGVAASPYLDAVAQLRITVFRAFPYLYDGDVDYESRYLSTYMRSVDSVVVLAFDADRVIGASTGIPLVDETDEFQQPFVDRGMALDGVFYCGESVLLPEYRGQRIGHRFFDEREGHARRLGGFSMTAFCAIVREQDDPRRPPTYRANDVFWRKRGYRRHDDMSCHVAWKEIGADASSLHELAFWTRPLEASP